MDSNFTIESILLRPSVQEYFSNYENHKKLLKDNLRISAFRKAIMEAVKPGDVVMDIGAGTGILSKFSFEAGAEKVYLIEENKNILDFSKNNLERWGYFEKCTFIPERSTNLKTKIIPEKVDVIISETIGSLGINEGIISTLYDAKRFLKDDGILIPSDIELHLAYIDDFDNFSIEEPVIVKTKKKISNVSAEKICYFNFLELESPDIEFNYNTKSNCLDKNICLWFRAHLFNEIFISNAPDVGGKTSWGVCIIPKLGELRGKLSFSIKNIHSYKPKIYLQFSIPDSFFWEIEQPIYENDTLKIILSSKSY